MTTLGTPLSTSATRVMLLGCGELGKEVIIALQRLGVEVIGVDRYADAPGHQVAHRAHVINMADGAALRRLIETERPHLVVPEIEAIATPMLLELERAGVATVIPTARAAWLTMNREGIRRLAAEELGLPTSPYRFAGSLAELFVAGDQVWFSEVSPRPHDTGMVTMASQHQSELELHARAILGLPVDVTLCTPAASAVIYGGVEARGIVFDGVDEALAIPGTDLRLFGKPESFRKRRMGVALARAENVEIARENARRAASKVRPRAA